MAINPIIWIFLGFGIILGLFILFYMWLEYRSRESPVKNLEDLVSKSRSKSKSSGVKSIPLETKPDTCPVCQADIKNLKVCKRCGFEIHKCRICSRIIKLDDDLVRCPYCGEKFHREEFLEWLKIKAFCPNCKVQMDLWEFRPDKDE